MYILITQKPLIFPQVMLIKRAQDRLSVQVTVIVEQMVMWEVVFVPAMMFIKITENIIAITLESAVLTVAIQILQRNWKNAAPILVTPGEATTARTMMFTIPGPVTTGDVPAVPVLIIHPKKRKWFRTVALILAIHGEATTA